MPRGASVLTFMTSILLIENQPLTRLGVRAVLDGEADIELIGESDNATEGFEL